MEYLKDSILGVEKLLPEHSKFHTPSLLCVHESCFSWNILVEGDTHHHLVSQHTFAFPDFLEEWRRKWAFPPSL